MKYAVIEWPPKEGRMSGEIPRLLFLCDAERIGYFHKTGFVPPQENHYRGRPLFGDPYDYYHFIDSEIVFETDNVEELTEKYLANFL